MTDTGTPTLEQRFAELAGTFLAQARAELGVTPALIPATGLIPDVVDGQLIESAWGNAVRNIGVARFDSFAALQAGWPAAPNGSRAITLDTFRTYTKRGTGAAGWQPDYASGLLAVTFSAGAGSITHDLGRTPGVCLVNVGQSSVNFLAVTGRTATTISVAAWNAAGSALAGNLNVWWWVA